MTAPSHRRIAKGALALASSQAMVLMVPLAATPIFSRVFDDETFGAWTILGSLFTLLSQQDLGICTALRVRLAELQVAGADARARRLYLSVLVCIAAGALAISAVTFLLRPPVGLLGLHPAQSTAADVAVAMGLLAVASAPSFHALYAYVESEWVALADVTRAVLQVIAAGVIFVATPGLVASLLVFYGPWLVYVLQTHATLLHRRKWPGFGSSGVRAWWAGRAAVSSLAVQGLSFWAFQLLYLAFGPIDVLLAGKFLGLAETGSVGLVLRLVNVGYTALAAVAWSYAGAFALQYARGDHRWIRKTITVMSALTVVAGLFAIVGFVWLGEPVIRIWSGRTVALHGVYFMAGILFLTGGLGRLLLSVLQSMGRVKRVLLPLVACALFKLGLALFLIPAWRAQGLLAASSLANLAVAAVAALELARLLRPQPGMRPRPI